MGTRVKTNLDEDVYDYVTERHDRTGRSKSEIVNGLARDGMNGDESVAASFWSDFGGAMFVAGPVVGLLHSIGPGLGMLIMGLMLMLWGNMLQYIKVEGMGYAAAFKRTLGA